MGNFEDTNLGKMITRLKYFYKAHTIQVRMQVIIIFLVTTIICGQAGQSLTLLTSGLGRTSWNPFLLLYYAWIRLFFFTLILNVILNTVILYVRINIDTSLYDKERNFEISKKGTMGTGGFMQANDKTKALIMDDIENIDGMILGRDPDTKLICSPKESLYINKHKVVCGGSGSRKTTTQVLNELFQSIKRRESFIVTDPKGEIYEMLAVMAEQEGYITRVMNLVNLENSDGIDFVKTCRDKSGKQDKEIEAVQTLAKVIMANTTENITGGFWDDNQRGLLTAAILYVMYDKTGRTETTLAGAYEFLLNNDKTEIDKLFTNLDKSHPARAEYLIYAKTDAKVRDSVLNGLMMRLQIFQTESAKRIVSSDEIDLTLPSKQKCAYFLIMSDQTSTFDFIASLFFSMFFIKEVQYVDSLKKQVRESNALIPVNLVMDEFPSIGTIPDFDKKLATVRSRKINITIIFQNYGQIMDKYEKNQWETIVANCDTNIYLGGNDSEKTAAYYSNRLGDMTVITKGKRTQDKLLSVTDNKFHPAYMTSESESGRPVMTKDELLRLDTNHAIVIMRTCRPLDVLKFVYTEHPMAKRIIERNSTIHIPNWRREMEGYPDLTDNELESTVEMLIDTNKMREYLELHSNNKTYCLMDYLYDEFPNEYKKLKTLLEEKEGKPFIVPQEELDQRLTGDINDEEEDDSNNEQPEGSARSDSPASKTPETSFSGNIPPLAKPRGQKANIPEQKSAADRDDDSTATQPSATSDGVKTVNLSKIIKSKDFKVDTIKTEVAKPEINPNDFMTGIYSMEAPVKETEQKPNPKVKTFGSRNETEKENQRVKSFGAGKRKENTESRFKKTSKDKINEEEQQNKRELERLQEQDIKTPQEETQMSQQDKEGVKDEKSRKMELSSANQVIPEAPTQEAPIQEASVQKEIQTSETISESNDSTASAFSDTEISIIADKRPETDKEYVSDEEEQPVADKAEQTGPEQTDSEQNGSDGIENENLDIYHLFWGDFEDFNPDMNKVVLPEATGEEPEDDIIIDMLPENVFSENVLPKGMLSEATEEKLGSEEILLPKEESVAEEEKDMSEKQKIPEPEFIEYENPDDGKIIEPENQAEDTLSSTYPDTTVAPPKDNTDIPQKMELDIPVDKELNQDDFSLFSDTEESSAVVSGEENATTKRTADKKKKGIRKMSRDIMNF